jgi:hypothetical protein
LAKQAKNSIVIAEHVTTTTKPIIPRVAVASHYSGAAEFIQKRLTATAAIGGL